MNTRIRTAIILCGGRGSRLGDLGKKIPKTLAKVQGREILWYIINILKKNKFNHIILPLGYKGNLIKLFLKKNKFFDMNIDYVNTGVNTNIGSRIARVQNKIKSDDILLLNGDAIFNINLDKIFKLHEKNKTEITFLSGEITYPYGTIGIEKGEVKEFKRNLVYDALTIRSNKSYIAYNYTGISIIKSKFLEKMKNLLKKSINFEQFFFPKIIKRKKCKIVKINGFWHSVDNIKDLNAVDNKLNDIRKYSKVKIIKKIIEK